VQDTGQNGARRFATEVVSAVGEAFNNIAIHAYGGEASAGDVDIEIDTTNEKITLRMSDLGCSFDPTRIADPDLTRLPESGMGVYIMKSFMDTVDYRAGAPPAVPNVLVLTKRRVRGPARQSATLDEESGLQHELTEDDDELLPRR
jgi:serine/threonine-protein kinase RsbW